MFSAYNSLIFDSKISLYLQIDIHAHYEKLFENTRLI